MTTITLGQFQKKLTEIRNKPDIDRLSDFKMGVTGILIHVTDLINAHTGINAFSLKGDYKDTMKGAVAMLLFFLVTSFTIYEATVPENPEDLWIDQTEPGMDMILAKLSHFASNLFSVTYSTQEDVFDSNMEYDLRNLVKFLHVFSKNYGFTISDACEAAINIANQ